MKLKCEKQTQNDLQTGVFYIKNVQNNFNSISFLVHFIMCYLLYILGALM